MMGWQSHHGRSMSAGYRQFFEAARAKGDEHFIRVDLSILPRAALMETSPDAGRTKKT